MSDERFALGQEVIVRDLYRRGVDGRGEVVKIGRKWVTVAIAPHGFTVQFDKLTGYENAGNFSAQQRILTVAMLAEEEERAELAERLLKHGLKGDGYRGELKMSTERLRLVVEVLDRSAVLSDPA